MDHRVQSDETGEVDGYAAVECTGAIDSEAEHFIGFHCETLDIAAAHWRAMFKGTRT